MASTTAATTKLENNGKTHRLGEYRWIYRPKNRFFVASLESARLSLSHSRCRMSDLCDDCLHTS